MSEEDSEKIQKNGININLGGSYCSLSFMLFILFLILKLTGNITWSWWWVTLPIWWPILILPVGLIGILVIIGIILLILIFVGSIIAVIFLLKFIIDIFLNK